MKRFARGAIVMVGTMTLTGCTQISTVTSLLTNVRSGFVSMVTALAPFAAIAMVFYVIAYAILFFLQPIWPDGYRTISNTSKTALYIFVILLIVLPALSAWASSYTLSSP